MNAFQQDGMVVFQQPFCQHFISPGSHNIRELQGKPGPPFFTRIIKYLLAKFIQFGAAAVFVLKAMQAYLHASLMQRT